MRTGRVANWGPESRLRICVVQLLREWLRRTGVRPRKARRTIMRWLRGQIAEAPTAVLVAGPPVVVGLAAAVAVPAGAAETAPAVSRRCRVPSSVPTLASMGVGRAITPELIFAPGTAHRFAP